jgi:tetratricopeptide (TPR) repeat protein
MRNFTQAILLLLAAAAFGLSQHADHTAPDSTKPIRLLDPTGFVHMKVSTSNPEAQRYFDQGLTLSYAYNRWDALRSYKRAVELDPSLAMAWCAIADSTYVRFSGQPDYAEKMKESREAIGKALSLRASPKERAYIEASARLISDAEKLDRKTLDAAYSDAIKKIYERWPDDPDAAAAYAGELGWDWSKDGKPLGNTSKTVELLERALKRNPKHLGLNHYYIHAVEASSWPERALAAADYLRSLKLNEPELGHLVHMPAHIYVRVGDFQKAAESNMETAKMSQVHMTPEFNDWHFSHVYSFLRLSYYMQGNYEKLRANSIASFDWAFPNPDANRKMMRGINFESMVGFRRWKEILDLQIPEEPPRPNFQYAKAYALAATGKVAEAEEIYRKYLIGCKCDPDGVDTKNPDKWEAVDEAFKRVEASKLAARIAEAKGDNDRAIEYLGKAVPIEDELPYSEPPVALYPVRVSLGGLLLRTGRFAEAEDVFRKDLQSHRGNGRSLFGLMKALEGQNKEKEAKRVEKLFRHAWRHADTPLTINEL